MRPTMFRSVRKTWVGPAALALALVCAAAGGPAGAQQTKKLPWSHAFDLACRKFGEAEFTDKTQKGGVKEWKDAAKFGIEVYRDPNTGNLVYICETGSIAVIPEGTEVKGEGKAPEWLHGLDLSCRKSSETSFTKDTRKYGVEVYRDE